MTAPVFTTVLGYIGRRGTTALSVSIFVGVALPSLSTYLRPYLTLAVLSLLALAFLRVDHAAIKAQLRRPGYLLAALAWMMIGLPFFTFVIFNYLAPDTWGDDIMLAIYIGTAAPPVMAAPVFCICLVLMVR